MDDFISIRPDKKLGVSEHSQQSQQSHANGAMFEKFIWLRYMGCLKPACESIREPMREPAREPTRGRRALPSCERVRWSSGVIRGRVVWLAETGRPRNEDWVDCVFHRDMLWVRRSNWSRDRSRNHHISWDDDRKMLGTTFQNAHDPAGWS